MDFDRHNNPMCGQSFMAGTICSDRPGHAGAHSAKCQQCGGDWMNETCICIEHEGWCDFCAKDTTVAYPVEVEIDDTVNSIEKYTYNLCHDCYDDFMGQQQPEEPTDDDMEYVLQSLGIRTLVPDQGPPDFSSPSGDQPSPERGD